MFLKNTWYVVALDGEVTRELKPFCVLGERLVVYRTERGVPVALEDSCPHRGLPLSMGRLKGDEIECGYHGLTFAPSGACTRIPTAKRVPASIRVRSYPSVSRYGLVWCWMGEPEKADADAIFPVERWGDPAWGRNEGGSMSVDCNYLYVTDNLLDPSHVAWVHRSSFGDEACGDEPIESRQTSLGVVASRWLRNVEVAPFYRPLVPFVGPCDRLQHYEVRFPCHAIIRALFVPAGAGGPDKPLHEHAMIMDSYNFLTPVDQDHTKYFWFQMRNVAPNDPSVSQMMDQGVREAFAEDRAVLNAVHKGFAHQAGHSINLASDRAPLLFRRELQRLIASEQTRNAPRE